MVLGKYTIWRLNKDEYHAVQATASLWTKTVTFRAAKSRKFPLLLTDHTFQLHDCLLQQAY